MVLQRVYSVKMTRTELIQACRCVCIVLRAQHQHQAVRNVGVKKGTHFKLQRANNAWLVHSNQTWELLLAFPVQQVRMESSWVLTIWYRASIVLQANTPCQEVQNVQAVKQMHFQ